MERGPSRNSREQIRKGSLRSSSMYGAAQDNNVLESSGRDEINESQLEPRITEKKYVVPKLGGNANTSGGLITIHTPHRGYGGGTPRILLTTRALRQHNIQQENISQQKQIIAMKPIKVSDREIFVAYGDGYG